MYKISKLNHRNTNSLNLVPGMTTIRSTVHQCHINVPQTFNVCCLIPFQPSIRNCCTCKLSYIGKPPSPNHPTDDTPVMLNWIKVGRFGRPRHELAKGSKSCVRYEKSHHLASGTYPCDFQKLKACLDTHTGLQTLTMLFS